MSNPKFLSRYFDKEQKQWKPMEGSRWGRLLVVRYLGRKAHGDGTQGWYFCLCECGNTVNRKHACLTQKQTVSCGCWKAEKVAIRRRKEDTAFNDLWGSYKKGARERGFDWTLTKEQFKELTSSACYYTGRPPYKEAHSCDTNRRIKAGLEPFKGGIYIYNGVDRLDSTKGYTVENCVPCCELANMAKKTMTEQEFLDLCREVAQHHLKL
jgi:hypothetical protein